MKIKIKDILFGVMNKICEASVSCDECSLRYSVEESNGTSY